MRAQHTYARDPTVLFLPLVLSEPGTSKEVPLPTHRLVDPPGAQCQDVEGVEGWVQLLHRGRL